MKECRIGEPLPMGAAKVGKSAVQFVSKANLNKETSLVLYETKTGTREEYRLTDKFRIGNVYSVIVEGVDAKKYTYSYLMNGKEILDPYVRAVRGNEAWGKKEGTLSGIIAEDHFDWEGDRPLMNLYEKSVIYQLHVRGFTKHMSSGVRKKGTFEGICEKLPYLKELGVTALELLPAYEFLECENRACEYAKMELAGETYRESLEKNKSVKINYWGFKEACYFAPKASYSGTKDPIFSFKNMVKELHKAGIEVLMQFYFPMSVDRAYLLEVIKYWVREYHIDGVRLLGVNLPVEVLATQPELCNTKIMYEAMPLNEIYHGSGIPAYKNLAVYNDGYLYAVRRFLKGDVGSLAAAFHAMTEVPHQGSGMVYVTNYNTFTLRDLVSYDRKHNEDNGENGKDGSNYNLSWNCGVEGPTKKKHILSLRERQMRNAIVFLMLSKGTPVILSGDEFGNSQGGNNNPYCQDNAVSWLNWKELVKNEEQFAFTRKMISFMKEYPFFKWTENKREKKNGAEYPYLSFHGSEAWKLDWSAANEEAGGILYYEDHIYLYLGINMHWEEKMLALPVLFGEHEWKVVIDTFSGKEEMIKGEAKSISMAPRSIKILIAEGSKEDFDESLSAF